jgi:hypothetical protein
MGELRVGIFDLPSFRRQLLANAAIAASRVAS